MYLTRIGSKNNRRIVNPDELLKEFNIHKKILLTRCAEFHIQFIDCK